MNTPEGRIKASAKVAGISVEEYKAHLGAGEKRCYRCKQWKRLEAFTGDSSRGDGKKARCRECASAGTRPGPSIPERRARRLLGEEWCRRCEAWKPSADMHAGLCSIHQAEYERERYAKDAAYRAERRQHAHARKRGVAPVPAIGQTILLDDLGGRCAYCPAPATTWDHIVPVIKGGPTKPWNVVPACARCNSSKGDSDLEEWLERRGLAITQLLLDRMDLENVHPF